jgi:hypothetical protein
MIQTEYNNLSEKIKCYKKNMYIIENSIQKKNINNYIIRLEKMLDDEYKYGSSLYEHKLIQKYIKKCDQIISC